MSQLPREECCPGRPWEGTTDGAAVRQPWRGAGVRRHGPHRALQHEVAAVAVAVTVVELNCLSSAACRGDGGTGGGGEGGGSSGWSSTPSLLLFSVYGKVGRSQFPVAGAPVCFGGQEEPGKGCELFVRPVISFHRLIAD